MRWVSRERKQGYGRSTGERETNVNSSAAKVLVSFEKLDETQPKGQPESFELWQKEQRLADLMDKVRRLNQLTLLEAQQQQIIAVYGGFPTHGDFIHPRHVQDDVKWGVVKRIGGQKPRVAGYFEANIFYCVFLDQEHRFWPTTKKKT